VFELVGVFVPELNMEMVLPFVETNTLLDGLERLFVDLGTDQDFQEVEQSRGTVDLGGLQALDVGAQVGKSLEGVGPSLLDASPKERLDGFRRLDERSAAGHELVYELTEKLRSGLESVERLGLRSISDEVGEGHDDLVHNLAIPGRFVFQELVGVLHLSFGDLAVDRTEPILEGPVPVAVLSRHETITDDGRVEANARPCAVQKRHLHRPEEPIQGVAARLPILRHLFS
jgi:hypothetical protein